MKKTISVKEENGQNFIELKDFSDHIDISKVVYYEMTEVKEKEDIVGLIIKFFDKNKKRIYPKKKEKRMKK